MSLQWSSRPEPTNTELGTSQDGTCGGTKEAERRRQLELQKKYRVLSFMGRQIHLKEPEDIAFVDAFCCFL